jgi:hypothetical protein
MVLLVIALTVLATFMLMPSDSMATPGDDYNVLTSPVISPAGSTLDPATGNQDGGNGVFTYLTALNGWDATAQDWHGFFPAGVSVPGTKFVDLSASSQNAMADDSINQTDQFGIQNVYSRVSDCVGVTVTYFIDGITTTIVLLENVITGDSVFTHLRTSSWISASLAGGEPIVLMAVIVIFAAACTLVWSTCKVTMNRQGIGDTAIFAT